jgi:molybdopterin synthase sulfur carrier subunit
MRWKLFADLAETAGAREVEVGGDPDTVGAALDALVAEHPDLRERVLDGETVREDVNLLRNGESLRPGAGLDAPVDEDDELALFPPVSGG